MNKRTEFIFGVGFKSNKESNDFLRCLWARMSAVFGKIAWQTMPTRMETTIFVGAASLAEGLSVEVVINYKIRGAVSSISFSPCGSYDASVLKAQLCRCVQEALGYRRFLKEFRFRLELDRHFSFEEAKGKRFLLKDNSLEVTVDGFDEEDASSLFKSYAFQICNLLTYDTLRYVSIKGDAMEEIRETHNRTFIIINGKTGSKVSSHERNASFVGLSISQEMVDYIDEYLTRPYMYEEHMTLFDKSTQMFAEGVRNEELASEFANLFSPFAETATINYMSALEVISLSDFEPTRCELCGQLRYSISRRVIDFVSSVFPYYAEQIKRFYKERSKYVHCGALLSNQSYAGRSIPLMSRMSESGILVQHSFIDPLLKEVVRECIRSHEINANATHKENT